MPEHIHISSPESALLNPFGLVPFKTLFEPFGNLFELFGTLLESLEDADITFYKNQSTK